MYYSIIVPVYNGEKTIRNLFLKVQSFFAESKKDFEMILVHDCGPDNSWKVMLELNKEFPQTVRIVKLSRNFGQHNAIICGIEQATGDFIITMDEDLQHDPFDIQKLIEKQAENDFDVVYGKYEERKHSIIRNLGSYLLKTMISKGIPDIHPDYSAFRLIKSNIAKSLLQMRNSYTFIDGYISWVTTHCASCMVSHSDRQGGVSSYTFQKLVNHTINIFVTFSNYPLKLLIKTSIVIFTLNLIFTAYIISRKIIYNDFALGYPSLIISIGFGVALIILSIGVIGEYIYRINLKTTKKPNYFSVFKK
jgi:undecaprenyl-phosphate 4-deoxy-4-formamido-L-arabinose transferase